MSTKAGQAQNWRLSAPDSPSCIGEFRSVARLALLLHKSQNRPLVLRLRTENGDPLETVEDIRGNEALDPQALRMWRTIDRFCDLAQRFGIGDGERVGRKTILENTEAIDVLHSALFASGATATFNASLESPPQELHEAHEMAMLSCPYVVLEHYVLGACIALVGSPSLQRVDAARWTLSVPAARVRVMREFVVPRDGYAALGSQAILTEATRMLNVEGISVVVHPSEPEDAVAD